MVLLRNHENIWGYPLVICSSLLLKMTQSKVRGWIPMDSMVDLSTSQNGFQKQPDGIFHGIWGYYNQYNHYYYHYYSHDIAIVSQYYYHYNHENYVDIKKETLL